MLIIRGGKKMNSRSFSQRCLPSAMRSVRLRRDRPESLQKGMVLLETLIAIVIFSMGILAIIGLQSASKKLAVDAKFRSDAGFLASQTISQMWVDWSNIASYNGTAHPATDVTEPASNLLPGGTRTINVQGDAVNGYQVSVTVGWTLPGGSNHQHTIISNMHN